MLNKKKADIFYVSKKLVIPRSSHTIWSIFSSFLMFYFYFTDIKAPEISRQNMRNSENINGHIVLETVR